MHLLSDILIMTWRNLIKYRRVPQLLIFSTIQPVLFLLLFTYVFGGAIKVPGNLHYINFLLPGILVQITIFGSIQTGVGLADDVGRGVIDRFKSLPMARSAVLAGRTIADVLRNVFVIALMTGVGYLIGFRFQGTALDALAAVALMLLFGFAFAWISATIGLAVKNTETAQVAGFIWVFPLVFASSIFVPVETMPNWLQAFAKISPITVTVDMARHYMQNLPTSTELWQPIAWIVGMLLIFMPLAVWQYRKGS